MFTYSHANTPLGQSERAYYLIYFIILHTKPSNKLWITFWPFVYLLFTGSVVAIIVVVWILSSLAGSMIEFLPLEQKKFYGIIVTVAFFFTPLIVILVAYGTIFHIARAHARGRGVSSFKKVLCYAIAIDSHRKSTTRPHCLYDHCHVYFFSIVPSAECQWS